MSNTKTIIGVDPGTKNFAWVSVLLSPPEMKIQCTGDTKKSLYEYLENSSHPVTVVCENYHAQSFRAGATFRYGVRVQATIEELSREVARTRNFLILQSPTEVKREIDEKTIRLFLKKEGIKRSNRHLRDALRQVLYFVSWEVEQK